MFLTNTPIRVITGLLADPVKLSDALRVNFWVTLVKNKN
jgi:hypothetical protein